MDFDPRLTVLVATNGQGKTAILDAIRIALWPYVSAYDVVSGSMPDSGIDIDDVRLVQTQQNTMEPQLPASVSAQGSYHNETITWSRRRQKVSKGSKTSVKEAKPLAELGNHLQSAIRIHSEHDTEDSYPDVVLPVVAHYGTARLWKQRKLPPVGQNKSSFFSRSYAYVGCLDSGSDYNAFNEWFRHLFFADFEQRTKRLEKKGFSGLFSETVDYGLLISTLTTAVDDVMYSQGWKGFRYSLSKQVLEMEHSHHGTLKVNQLSDGLRNIIAMTADIACRCVRLNPQLGEHAAKNTEGIVLIDEVDMHLHPSWQQTIMSSLQEAFPKIQFIVTTHSPQVLSTVPKECIRVLGTNIEGEAIAVTPLAASYGEPSNDVLQAIMHVDPQPPVAEKKQLDELTSLVDQGEYLSYRAQELLIELKQKLNEQHPQIQKIERSIRRQAVLKG
jgi:predicted ATP-binding protein involved in virulence